MARAGLGACRAETGQENCAGYEQSRQHGNLPRPRLRDDSYRSPIDARALLPLGFLCLATSARTCSTSLPPSTPLSVGQVVSKVASPCQGLVGSQGLPAMPRSRQMVDGAGVQKLPFSARGHSVSRKSPEREGFHDLPE